MKNMQQHRGEGAAKQVGGKIEKGIGKVLGNERLEAEGQAKEAEGYTQKEAAKAGERLKGGAQQVGGKIAGKVGDVLDDGSLEAKGKIKELEGKARQKANKPS